MTSKPIDQGPHFVFRNVQDFAAAFQTAPWPSGLFYGTYRQFQVDQNVSIKVSLGRGKQPLILGGIVRYLRRARRHPRLGGGVGIDLLPGARPKLEYLLELARLDQATGPEGTNRRRHDRLPLDLPVSWQKTWSQVSAARLGDIGFGGAFVKDVDSLPIGDVLLGISVPGTSAPTIVSARVAWVRYEGPPGFGVKWRARDTGGLRLIRELVARIKMPPAAE